MNNLIPIIIIIIYSLITIMTIYIYSITKIMSERIDKTEEETKNIYEIDLLSQINVLQKKRLILRTELLEITSYLNHCGDSQIKIDIKVINLYNDLSQSIKTIDKSINELILKYELSCNNVKALKPNK